MLIFCCGCCPNRKRAKTKEREREREKKKKVAEWRDNALAQDPCQEIHKATEH